MAKTTKLIVNENLSSASWVVPIMDYNTGYHLFQAEAIKMDRMV